MKTLTSDHLPRIPDMSHQRRDETRLYYARLGMFPEIGGAYHLDSLEDCPLCNKKSCLGRSGATIQHLLVHCSAVDCCRKDEQGKEVNLIKFLWEQPTFSFSVLKYIYSLFLFFDKNKNISKNILQSHPDKPIFTPFSSSLLTQKQQTKNKTTINNTIHPKNNPIPASVKNSSEPLLGRTFSYDTPQISSDNLRKCSTETK